MRQLFDKVCTTKCILEDLLEGISSVGDERTCLNSFQYEYGIQNWDRCIIRISVCHNIKPILTVILYSNTNLGLGLILYYCVVRIMHLIHRMYSKRVGNSDFMNGVTL